MYGSRPFFPSHVLPSLAFLLFVVFVAVLYWTSYITRVSHSGMHNILYLTLLVLSVFFVVAIMLSSSEASTNESPCAFHSDTVHMEEWKAIKRRRQHAGIEKKDSQSLCAVSLPGGGIRQANFASGVMLALTALPRDQSKRPLWRHVDMLSSVSGGGYAATSMISHMLRPTGDFDLMAFRAAANSAKLLRQHANWPMKSNWPNVCDDFVRHDSCFAVVYSVIFLACLGVVQFLMPFVLLWSISVSLLPITLVFTIDIPAYASGQSSCKTMWRAWWLSSSDVIYKFAFSQLCLFVLRIMLARHSNKLQGQVNRIVSKQGQKASEAENPSELKDLVRKHARVTSVMHLVRAILGICCMAWLFAAAFAAAGFNCGTFMGSRIKWLDIGLLGSVALLLVMCQSSDAVAMRLPTVFLILGSMLMYSIACVHFDAWMLGSGCDVDCPTHHLGSLFYKRHFYFAAIVLWGCHPIIHNGWSNLMPRWYSWKLSRFLSSPSLTMWDLHQAYTAGAPAPYLLMCCTVHHIWRLPRIEFGSLLERILSSTFVFSPLFVGDHSIGFVTTDTTPHREFRVSGAAAISGAATSNQIGQKTAPLHHMLTFFSGLLFGMWLQFEPDTKSQQRTFASVIMLCFTFIHLLCAAALLISYELCVAPLANGPLHWSCPNEGSTYVMLGLALFVTEICVLPVFITWVKPFWRTPWLGKWMSEWMQLQGFCFPHGTHGLENLPRHVYLSDGGHIDNQGLLEPLRRRSRLILCPHSGHSNTHTSGNMKRVMALASEDPFIHASFTPLAWDGEHRRFKRQSGNMIQACNKFEEDMQQNILIIGVEYSPYKFETSHSDTVTSPRSEWAIMIVLANRPLHPTADLDAALSDVKLHEALQLDGLEHTSERSANAADPLLQNTMLGKAVKKTHVKAEDLYSRLGICCSCCHHLPKALHRMLTVFNRFPTHHTAIQCLTPELGEAYQCLGFAVTSMNIEILEAACDWLEAGDQEDAPWL